MDKPVGNHHRLLSAIRALPDRELLQGLLNNESEARFYRQVTRERMIVRHLTWVLDYAVQIAKAEALEALAKEQNVQNVVDEMDATIDKLLADMDVATPSDKSNLEEPKPQEPKPEESQKPLLELNYVNFPWKDEELVLPWMQRQQLYEFARRIVYEDGYRAEGLADPEKAMEWIMGVIEEEVTWAELHPPAVRFWKAVRSKVIVFRGGKKL